MKRNVRWTAASASALLDAQIKSGLSMEGFARLRGFHGSRLRWWKERLASSEVTGGMQLLPVRVAGPVAALVEEMHPELEMVLRNGTVVRVRGRWDATTVRAMVTGVEGC